jgi:hypothetical protein
MGLLTDNHGQFCACRVFGIIGSLVMLVLLLTHILDADNFTLCFAVCAAPLMATQLENFDKSSIIGGFCEQKK